MEKVETIVHEIELVKTWNSQENCSTYDNRNKYKDNKL